MHLLSCVVPSIQNHFTQAAILSTLSRETAPLNTVDMPLSTVIHLPWSLLFSTELEKKEEKGTEEEVEMDGWKMSSQSFLTTCYPLPIFFCSPLSIQICCGRRDRRRLRKNFSYCSWVHQGTVFGRSRGITSHGVSLHFQLSLATKKTKISFAKA